MLLPFFIFIYKKALKGLEFSKYVVVAQLNGDKLMRVRADSIPSVKVENYNYFTISPENIPKDAASSFEFATVINFGSTSDSFYIAGRGNTFYVCAKNGTVINNLELMFWFYEKNRRQSDI